MRVLIVEDTIDVGEAIMLSFSQMGHAADWVHDGITADHQLCCTEYDLVVLDLMIPGIDGIAVLRKLRSRGSETPVLVLTARSAVSERVEVLDIGADDYLCKPFDFAELQARARSLLRRRNGDRTNVLSFGGIKLDRATRQASVNDDLIQLTRREISLLELLLTRPNQLLSKSQILESLFNFDAEPTENAVEVLMGRLRRKLEPAPAQIITQRGLGYQLRL